MLDQVILARKAIAALAGAMLNGAIAEHGVVHTGLVALQVCETRERLATVVTPEWFGRSVGGGHVSACVERWEAMASTTMKDLLGSRRRRVWT